MFHTTAAKQNQLAKIFQVFPTFLNETRATMARLKSFSLDTDPLIQELDPVAQNLGPTLHAVQELSPNLRSFFYTLALRPASKGNNLVAVSQTGLPAVSDVLAGAKPLLGSLGPFLEQLNPIFDWLSLHQQLISDFVSNGATGLAATTTTFGGAGLKCNGARAATTCASSARPVPRRCRSTRTATRTTAATRIRRRCGPRTRVCSRRAFPRRLTARTPGPPATGQSRQTTRRVLATWRAGSRRRSQARRTSDQIPHITAAQYSDR